MKSNFVVVGGHRTCHIPVITTMMHGEVFLIYIHVHTHTHIYMCVCVCVCTYILKNDAINNEEKDTPTGNFMLRRRGSENCLHGSYWPD